MSIARGAHASTRVTVTAMAMGQAAGCAAAMAMKSGTVTGELDGVKVREELGRQNAGPFTDA